MPMKNLHIIKFIPMTILAIVLAISIGLMPKLVTQIIAAEPVKAKEKAPAKATEPAKEPAKAKEKAPSPAFDPKDPKSILYMDTKGVVAGTGDPTKTGPASAGIKIGAGWDPGAPAATLTP